MLWEKVKWRKDNRQHAERWCCGLKEGEKGKLHWGIFKQIIKEAGRAPIIRENYHIKCDKLG